MPQKRENHPSPGRPVLFIGAPSDARGSPHWKTSGRANRLCAHCLFVPCYREIDPLLSRIDSLFSRAGNSLRKLLKSHMFSRRMVAENRRIEEVPCFFPLTRDLFGSKPSFRARFDARTYGVLPRPSRGILPTLAVISFSRSGGLCCGASGVIKGNHVGSDDCGGGARPNGRPGFGVDGRGEERARVRAGATP